ncbi:hypothetical protein JCM11641_005696 [Rhodosporidiobolus odoratus]
MHSPTTSNSAPVAVADQNAGPSVLPPSSQPEPASAIEQQHHHHHTTVDSISRRVDSLDLTSSSGSTPGSATRAAASTAESVGATTGARNAPLTLPPQGGEQPKATVAAPAAVITEEAAKKFAPSSLSNPSTPSASTPSSSDTSTSRPSLSPATPSTSSAAFPRSPATGPNPGRKPPAGATGPLKPGARPGPGQGGPLRMPPSLAAKMAAMTSRSSGPSSASPVPSLKVSPATAGGPAPPVAPRPGQQPGGGMAARRRGPGAGLTLAAMGLSSSGEEAAGAPVRPPGGLAARRGGGMKLPGGGGGVKLPGSGGADEPPSPNSAAKMQGQQSNGMVGGTPFSNFRKIVDPSGRLNFASKAILHADGVDFSSGASFKIKMDEFELLEELGKGNYGTVQKVMHRPTGVTMALKEIRLELDDSKLKTIITELDILHRATSPHIIDFYGAFFIESCVYYCMEYMDGGSLDFFAGTDVPEDVLARITTSMVEGLRFLKEELKIMHRDVKPTNVLISRKGAVKLCDFGVSGQLDRSIAKTNIGCQSYMAPERIKGESMGAATSYTASSDVWSLGLSIIEAAIGHYPYPPETYQNVFAQLTAIVHGDPPSLPDTYSETGRHFVEQCLIKQADMRPTYRQLLQHPWLAGDIAKGPDGVDMVSWVDRAMEFRKTNPKVNAPALA